MKRKLAEIIEAHGPLGVLVSGGCDSEVLLRAAAAILGPGSTVALTARTPLIPSAGVERAETLAKELGVVHSVYPLNLLENREIALNRPLRCYHCKRLIYAGAGVRAEKLGAAHLADGTNLDDTRERRPGLKAAAERGILHPFALAGMGKREVRNLGRKLGMPDPERPADSCLATRLQENRRITPELLSLVEELEAPLKGSVRGRLRAVIREGVVAVSFPEADAEPVLSRKEAMEALAEIKGFSLVLVPGSENPVTG